MLTSIARAEPGDEYESQLAERRSAYVVWIIDTFGALEPSMDPMDGRRWALNHARLVLNRDLEKANRYFESFSLTQDSDICFIRALKSLLDFRDSSRLSDGARRHLTDLLTSWPKSRLSTVAHWPAWHTENHDLMHLTIGMFAEQARGGDVSHHLTQIGKALAWRFERGWVEWNSPCYQFHYTNPLIVLADHAPSEKLRAGATDVLNLLFAERIVLGVNGYLGGPAFRCRTADANNSMTARKVAYLEDNRYDGFLPTVWLAFGLGEPRFDFANARVEGLEPATVAYASGNEPRLKQDEGMFFATSSTRPHPVLVALSMEAATWKSVVYSGRRHLGWPAEDLWATQRWMPGALYYYNTPHISMGSLHSSGYCCQSRYSNVMFAADPSKNLRVEMILPGVVPNKRRHEARGRLVQHKNWLLGQGTLFEDGGVISRPFGPWNVYRVGKGLCAQMELPESYHVLQVSDLDTYASEAAFAEALTVPTMEKGVVSGTTTDGDRVDVHVDDMSLRVNGTPRPHPPTMLHDSPYLRSEFGSGRITIHAAEKTLTLDRRTFYDGPTDTPQSGDLMTVEGAKPAGPLWGNATSTGRVTTANHVRALGGRLFPDSDIRLKSVSVALPWESAGSIRIAVYAGGDLAAGPHAGTRARLVHDFGKTSENARGWVTLEIPGEGVLIPAGSVVWIAWNGQGGRVPLLYQESSAWRGDFQAQRGRFESKAVACDENEPWPAEWPDDPQGSFAAYWYSFCLSYQ
ncbi:MAG: hypothetical protein ABIP48_15365 [Planctomycetota bacterium]